MRLEVHTDCWYDRSETKVLRSSLISLLSARHIYLNHMRSDSELAEFIPDSSYPPWQVYTYPDI